VLPATTMDDDQTTLSESYIPPFLYSLIGPIIRGLHQGFCWSLGTVLAILVVPAIVMVGAISAGGMGTGSSYQLRMLRYASPSSAAPKLQLVDPFSISGPQVGQTWNGFSISSSFLPYTLHASRASQAVGPVGWSTLLASIRNASVGFALGKVRRGARDMFGSAYLSYQECSQLRHQLA
jgi:hypothetical protein